MTVRRGALLLLLVLAGCKSQPAKSADDSVEAEQPCRANAGDDVELAARTGAAGAKTGITTAGEGIRTAGSATAGLLEGGSDEAARRWKQGKEETKAKGREGRAETRREGSVPKCR